jgi:hypothetical protein
MTARARFTQADLSKARTAADKAGLRLTGFEVRPDGTIRMEFGDWSQDNDDWRAGSPLYERAS